MSSSKPKLEKSRRPRASASDNCALAGNTVKDVKDKDSTADKSQAVEDDADDEKDDQSKKDKTGKKGKSYDYQLDRGALDLIRGVHLYESKAAPGRGGTLKVNVPLPNARKRFWRDTRAK